VPTLLAQVLLTFGLGCLVATLTTFVRDTAHMLGIGLTVLFYATPIVYPSSLVPPSFRPVLRANPLTHLTEWYRSAFTLHTAPAASSVLFVAGCAVLSAVLGLTLFHRARPHFADVI
jgi:lipopolysaccharide transport system permease protein